ncbi:MAG: hypothetical protein Kow0062_01560 [Acidobacteriota bacterium]|nr:MAG: DUF503 domain-containing protein [Acidobacteriota bacterium]
MRVGVLVLELYLPGALSLKDKRRVVRGLKDRCRARFNVAVAEVDHQDLQQRAGIAFSSVAGDEATLHGLFDRLREEAEAVTGGRVAVVSREIL